MNEATEKRTSVDVYDDLTLKLGHITALLDVMGECDKGQADVNRAAYGIQSMVEDVKGLLMSCITRPKEVRHDRNPIR